MLDAAAAAIAAVLRNPALHRNMGRLPRQRVRRHVLLTHLLEEWIDLIARLALKRQTAVSAQEPVILA